MSRDVNGSLVLTTQAIDGKVSKFLPAMGTVMNLTAYGEEAARGLDMAMARIARLDALLARMKPDSEIARLNSLGEWMPVDDDTDTVLQAALFYAQRTAGFYDPAVGTLVDLWNRYKHRGQGIPAEWQIQQALAACDYRKLERDGQGRYRVVQGASIDLGGIAKGYAAHCCYTLCQQQGISSALLSLGASSIAALGTKPDGTAWRVGLKNGHGGNCFGVIHLVNQFLSTSGDYERYFVLNGRRYHHILDKRTGYPATSGLRSVSVIAENGALSEAYSTALFVMGIEQALTFQQREGNFEAIFVTADERIVCTAGIADRFEHRSARS